MVPNLPAEIAFWLHIFQCDAWSVTGRHVDDLRHPRSGSPVWGLCYPEPDSRTARIEIRTPTTAAELAEWLETVVHEVLHCPLSTLGGPAVLEEQFVWPLARLCAWMKTHAPEALAAFARSLPWGNAAALQRVARSADSAPGRALLVARARARNGENKGMDKKAFAAMLALIKAAPPEEQPKLLEELQAQVDALPEEGAAPASGPVMSQDKPDGAAAGATEKPVMGMTDEKDEDELMKGPAGRAAAKAAARVLARTLPGLTAAQRTFAAALESPKAVEAYASTLAAAPAAKPEPKVEPHARMGLEALPGRGAGGDSMRARALRPPEDPEVRARLGLAEPGSDSAGINLDVPGHIIVFDHFKRQQEQRARKGAP